MSHAKQRAVDVMLRQHQLTLAAQIAAAIERANMQPAFCVCNNCYHCGVRNATEAAAEIARQAGGAS